MNAWCGGIPESVQAAEEVGYKCLLGTDIHSDGLGNEKQRDIRADQKFDAIRHRVSGQI